MRRFTRAQRALALALGGSTAVALSLTMVQAPATAAQHRHPLPGSKPHWEGRASHAGAVPDSAPVPFGVLLKMRDPSGAAKEIQQLTDPSSPNYRHWLTTKQFRAKYAPSKSDVAAVQHWLRQQGFHVTSTLPSGMLVQVTGKASQVEKTFDTSLQEYKYKGQRLRGNTSAMSLAANTPSAVVGTVGGVIGVDQGSTLKKPADTLPGPPNGGRYGVQPCSSYFGQKLSTDQPPVNGTHPPYAPCGYTPSQLQSAYGVTPSLKSGYTGKGKTVAITDAYASPTILSDANTYAARHNQPKFGKHQFRQITPGRNGYQNISACGGNGWYGEETLDVEAVHSIAPGANVVYVGGSDCGSGLDSAWASAIDKHVADVITNSWTDTQDSLASLGANYVNYYEEFSQEAAMTGITVTFSSGDDGDHTNGGTNPGAKTAEFPADLPYVTGVGGTSLQIGSSGQWKGEEGWESDYQQKTGSGWGAVAWASGGGGGASQLFQQPYYQQGKVPSSMSTINGTAMRTVPDMSMLADPNTGFRVGETQVFPNGTYYDEYRIGGTSLASPLAAGMFAIAGQRAGKAVGFVNPALYKAIGTSALHDLKAPAAPMYQVRTDYVNGVDSSQGYKYQLQTMDTQRSTLHDVPGYDDETGVGSPNGSAFFNLFR